MMAIPRGLEATALPDFNASWSNRNGGELLLTGGSIRMVVSAAWAQTIVDKFSRALDVPRKAASLVDARDGRAMVRELERLSDPEASIGEPLADRLAALRRMVPHRETRLSAVREARAMIEIDCGAAACIAGILFTARELAEMEVTLDDGMIAAGVAAAVQE